MIGPVWITYSWKDRKDDNFAWLVHTLKDLGIEAQYDESELIPGQYLWRQISDKIFDPNVKAWIFLLTPSSLASRPCMEEFELAFNRCLENKDDTFPIICLFSGVSVESIPARLRIRLCINLSDLGWNEKLLAAVERRPPKLFPPRPAAQFLWRIYDSPGSDFIGVEIAPRFPPMKVWSVGVPDTFTQCDFGIGISGTGQFEPPPEPFQRRDSWYEKEGIKFMLITLNSPISLNQSLYIKVNKSQKEFFMVFGPSISFHADPEFFEWIKIVSL